MNPTSLLKKLIYIVCAVSLLYASTISLVQAAGPNNFPNCRLGAGGAFVPNLSGYDLAQLNMGIYLDWWNNIDPHANLGVPTNVEYIHTVRVHQTKADYGSGWYGPPRVYLAPPTYKVSPDLTQIANIAASQPGSLWLIGNEIERVDWKEGSGWSGQDEITPELYAVAFHDIQAAIKNADPTARVSIGGIIQPTTLRLKYLDRVWNSYQTQYGHSMGQDIDVWNIHVFIIREVLNDWGADIPAGFNNNDADPTNNYTSNEPFLNNSSYNVALAAHHNMDYYRQFVEDFRAWMAAKGEQNKPLINTEYGILMDLNNTQVITFMEATFDYMFAATDATTGYPLDENRLLQGWIWYSLNDNVSPFVFGTLFNKNKNLTTVGNAWHSYVTDPANPLASQPRRNLLAANLTTEPNPTWVLPGQTTPVTLVARVANSGNTKTTTGNSIIVNFWDGPPHASGSNLIASQTIADIPGCGQFATVKGVWPNRPAGNHTWYVEVVPISGETSNNDNTSSGVATVLEGIPPTPTPTPTPGPTPEPFPDTTIYLPLILK